MSSVGFFGKLPSHGDFVQRRVSQSFLAIWDQWLQRCIAESKATLGEHWLDYYLTSPIWHFSMTSNVCGSEAYQGLLMPSVDRVGRYFPLCIIATSAPGATPFDIAAGSREWFQQGEAILLQCLEDDPPALDDFDRAIEELVTSLPDLSGSASVESPTLPMTSRSWRLIDKPGNASGRTLLRLADRIITDSLGPSSLWWTGDANGQAPAALQSQMLPDPQWYTDMLSALGVPQTSDDIIPEDWLSSDPAVLSASPPPAPAGPQSDPAHGENHGPDPMDFGTTIDVEDLSLEDLIKTPMRTAFSSAARTDVGKTRQENEDGFIDDAGNGLWLVADGMGGHAAGKTASDAVISAVSELELPADIDSRISAVSDCLQLVNTDMRQISGRNADYAGLGSTVAALVVADAACAVIWAGDTRVYRLRAGELQQLTTDHSERQEKIERGDVLSMWGPSNVVTRAIGGEDTLTLSTIRDRIQTGDRYLICSDGVHDELSATELATLLAESEAQGACEAVIDRVLAGRAKDNATAIVIDAVTARSGP